MRKDVSVGLRKRHTISYRCGMSAYIRFAHLSAESSIFDFTFSTVLARALCPWCRVPQVSPLLRDLGVVLLPRPRWVHSLAAAENPTSRKGSEKWGTHSS
jgi:hypothetical protein